MTDMDKICSKAKDKTSCYKCLVRIEQLLQLPELSPDDRQKVEAMAKTFQTGDEMPSELDLALLAKLSDHYLT